MSWGMLTVTSSSVLPSPLEVNQEVMLLGGGTLPAGGGHSQRGGCPRSALAAPPAREPWPRSPMFQVPMKMEIMSGSSWCECLFFISCSSWQKASRFWGGAGGEPPCTLLLRRAAPSPTGTGDAPPVPTTPWEAHAPGR